MADKELPGLDLLRVGVQLRQLGFPHLVFEDWGFVPGGMKGSTCDLMVLGILNKAHTPS